MIVNEYAPRCNIEGPAATAAELIQSLFDGHFGGRDTCVVRRGHRIELDESKFREWRRDHAERECAP